jgi:hypothetical protein
MGDNGLLNILALIASSAVDVAIYVWLALCLHIIAKKTNTPRPWLAWIPIANIYLMCKVAGKPGWWTAIFCLLIILMIPGAIGLVMLPFLALGGGEVPTWFLPAMAVMIVAGLVYWVLFIIIWMAIARARNWPSWMGILMFVPLANLVIPGILAFSNRPAEQT